MERCCCVVALFPVTLKAAPDQNHRPNASAVHVNNFSVSKRTISVRPNNTAANRNKGKREGWEEGSEGGSHCKELEETMAGQGEEGGSRGARWSESRWDVVGLKEGKRRRAVSKQEIDCRASVVVCFVVSWFFFCRCACSPAQHWMAQTRPNEWSKIERSGWGHGSQLAKKFK